MVRRDRPAGTPTEPESGRHIPVLLAEVLASLDPRDGETYIDATFGAGGYTRAILQAADCRVLAIDRDPSVIERARALSAEFPGRLTVIEAPFSAHGLDLRASRASVLVDGVVLDIGVSSMQLDEPERGFSFQADGPLDMRMSRAGRRRPTSSIRPMRRRSPTSSTCLARSAARVRSRAPSRRRVQRRRCNRRARSPISSPECLEGARRMAGIPQRARSRRCGST